MTRVPGRGPDPIRRVHVVNGSLVQLAGAHVLRRERRDRQYAGNRHSQENGRDDRGLPERTGPREGVEEGHYRAEQEHGQQDDRDLGARGEPLGNGGIDDAPDGLYGDQLDRYNARVSEFFVSRFDAVLPAVRRVDP